MVGSKDIELEPQGSDSDESEVDDGVVPSEGEYEVQKLLAICYGDPNKNKKTGLYFQVLSLIFQVPSLILLNSKQFLQELLYVKYG